MTAAEITDLVLRFTDAFDRDDLDAVMAFFMVDGDLTDLVSAGVVME